MNIQETSPMTGTKVIKTEHTGKVIVRKEDLIGTKVEAIGFIMDQEASISPVPSMAIGNCPDPEFHRMAGSTDKLI